jgi:microcystin degradation protein MlrC
MLRIAVGSIVHEANTFTPHVLEWPDIEAQPFLTGEDVIDRAESLESAIPGFLAVDAEVEWVPLLSSALPGGSGRLTVAAFERLRDELTGRIVAAGELDACLLSIGGGMVVDREGMEDADGLLLTAVREALPRGCCLGVALDMHANMTQRMIDAADVMLAYQTFPPHWDKREIGLQIASLVIGAARGEIEPVMALVSSPMLLQPEAQDTLVAPMKDVLAEADEVASRPGILSVSMVAGFGWCDVEEAGTSVIVIADGDRELAHASATELGRRWFERREAFRFPLVAIDDAVTRVLDHTGPKPLLLCDHSDNVGAGGAGDATALLGALLERGTTNVAFATMCDPEAVARCVETGVGGEVELSLGGKRDPEHARPLDVHGRVELLADGSYVNSGTLWTGKAGNLGRTAVVAIDGIQIVISERPSSGGDPSILTSHGIDPSEKSAIVIKSQIFGPKSYGDLIDERIVVAGNGWASSDFSLFSYRKLRRPIFPLDADVAFAGSA